METALPLLLFLGFLFGGMAFILAMGIWSREQDQADAADQELLTAEAWRARTSPFFAALAPDGEATPLEAADEAVVDRVQQFLRTEHAVATDFVSEPSVRRLYGRSDRKRRISDSFVDRVESWLRREMRQAAAFVSDPSVERLLGGDGQSTNGEWPLNPVVGHPFQLRSAVAQG